MGFFFGALTHGLWCITYLARKWTCTPGNERWCSGKESACHCRRPKRWVFNEWGRSPGVGNGIMLQYSCLGNFMVRGAWWVSVQFSSVQSLSRVWLFVTPWTAAHQAHQSITNSWSLLKLMFIKSVMPSNHLILCHPLLLLPSIFASIRVFSNESVLRIRWAKYWSFSFSISPSNEYPGLISFRMDWFDLFAVQGPLKSLLQHHSSKAGLSPWGCKESDTTEHKHSIAVAMKACSLTAELPGNSSDTEFLVDSFSPALWRYQSTAFWPPKILMSNLLKKEDPLYVMICFSCCFQDSLSFVFDSLIIMYLSVDLFAFILLEVGWASWMSVFISFIEFGEISVIISSYTLSVPFFLFSFWDSHNVHLMVSHRLLRFCLFFFNLFSFCSSDLIISIVLPSRLLILFCPVCSNLSLNLSSDSNLSLNL